MTPSEDLIRFTILADLATETTHDDYMVSLTALVPVAREGYDRTAAELVKQMGWTTYGYM